MTDNKTINDLKINTASRIDSKLTYYINILFNIG